MIKQHKIQAKLPNKNLIPSLTMVLSTKQGPAPESESSETTGAGLSLTQLLGIFFNKNEKIHYRKVGERNLLQAYC